MISSVTPQRAQPQLHQQLFWTFFTLPPLYINSTAQSHALMTSPAWGVLCSHNLTVNYTDYVHARFIWHTARAAVESGSEYRCILRSVLRCVLVHCTSHLGSRGCLTWHIFKHSEEINPMACALHVSCSERMRLQHRKMRTGRRGGDQGEWEEEFGKRNTGRTTGRESWGTRRNMKTAAVDKSAGCGDTPALWPGNSPPHSSAKTPFI